MKNITFIIISFFLFAALFVGKAHYDEGNSIENLTQALIWTDNFSKQAEEEVIENTNLMSRDERINKIVLRTVDYVGYLISQLTIFAIEFGYSHPDYNYILSFYVLLTIAIIQPLIIILVLIYILITEVIKLCKGLMKRFQR